MSLVPCPWVRGQDWRGRGSRGLEELDGHDLRLQPLKLTGVVDSMPTSSRQRMWSEVALWPKVSKADALLLGMFLARRLDLLVVEQVLHIFPAHLIKVVLPLDALLMGLESPPQWLFSSSCCRGRDLK